MTLPEFMIVAFLVGPIDSFDAFVITDPGFETQEACVDHAKKNGYSIHYHVMNETGAEAIENLYCLHRDVIEKFFGGVEEA